jgi:hypothetical protein
MGHGIVLNRIVPYYGSGKKLRHTIGYTECKYAAEAARHLESTKSALERQLSHPGRSGEGA